MRAQGRSPRLDKLLGELVTITFKNGKEELGVLEWNMLRQGIPSERYSLYIFGQGYHFFRKAQVFSIEEWRG